MMGEGGGGGNVFPHPVGIFRSRETKIRFLPCLKQKICHFVSKFLTETCREPWHYLFLHFSSQFIFPKKNVETDNHKTWPSPNIRSLLINVIEGFKFLHYLSSWTLIRIKIMSVWCPDVVSTISCRKLLPKFMNSGPLNKWTLILMLLQTNPL
jgi:hypothetical protein